MIHSLPHHETKSVAARAIEGLSFERAGSQRIRIGERLTQAKRELSRTA